jgi:hypothetical protein
MCFSISGALISDLRLCFIGNADYLRRGKSIETGNSMKLNTESAMLP